jgi:hypothetical protein
VSQFDAPEPIPAPRSVCAAHETYSLRVVHVSTHSSTQTHGEHRRSCNIVERLLLFFSAFMSCKEKLCFALGVCDC